MSGIIQGAICSCDYSSPAPGRGCRTLPRLVQRAGAGCALPLLGQTTDGTWRRSAIAWNFTTAAHTRVPRIYSYFHLYFWPSTLLRYSPSAQMGKMLLQGGAVMID